MPRRSPSRPSDRRNLSQNFIHDTSVVAQMCDLLAGPSLPVLDLGAGVGAVTSGLMRRWHQVTAGVLDPHWTAVLRRWFGGSVHVVDFAPSAREALAMARGGEAYAGMGGPDEAEGAAD